MYCQDHRPVGQYWTCHDGSDQEWSDPDLMSPVTTLRVPGPQSPVTWGPLRHEPYQAPCQLSSSLVPRRPAAPMTMLEHDFPTLCHLCHLCHLPLPSPPEAAKRLVPPEAKPPPPPPSVPNLIPRPPSPWRSRPPPPVAMVAEPERPGSNRTTRQGTRCQARATRRNEMAITSRQAGVSDKLG